MTNLRKSYDSMTNLRKCDAHWFLPHPTPFCLSLYSFCLHAPTEGLFFLACAKLLFFCPKTKWLHLESHCWTLPEQTALAILQQHIKAPGAMDCQTAWGFQ